jgi:hypothetical protein
VTSSLRRPLLALLAVALVAACGDDGGSERASAETTTSPPAARLCDAFLDYLAEPSAEHLDAVAAAADDPAVEELAAIIREDDRTGMVLAADSDLTDLARERCMPEWVGAAQGGGDTAGAAQAFLDALTAGDALGARNVASANVIATFEPWAPLEADAAAGTPAIVGVSDRTFTLALDPARIAECQVEGGVVIACTVAG